MTPAQVQDLVTKAFCLEVLADKPGCTTRFFDLPGKPLEDFVLAGINAAPFYSQFAADRLNGSKRLYSLFEPALKASNTHKSAKYVNLGLLEVMFNAVAARLACNHPGKVVKQINTELKLAPETDVRALVAIRDLGWKTSKNWQKLELLEKMKTSRAKTPYQFNAWLVESMPADSASFQWGDQAASDWSIVADIFERLQTGKNPSLLDKITAAYVPVAKENPDTKVGILADMSAAAIFLHLSFM